jgi:lactoylglutathione lyase
MKINIIKIFLFITLSLIFCSKARSQKQMPTLNHITIHVYDLKKSAAFYQNIIMLDTIPEPFQDGRHVFFKIGEHSQLHLVKGAKKITKHDKTDHIAFKVSSVKTFLTRLNKAGISYEDGPGKKNSINIRKDGVKQIYFQDPDGYWIEINDDKY